MVHLVLFNPPALMPLTPTRWLAPKVQSPQVAGEGPNTAASRSGLPSCNVPVQIEDPPSNVPFAYVRIPTCGPFKARSAKESATTVRAASVRTYGTVLRLNRVETLDCELDSHAL